MPSDRFELDDCERCLDAGAYVLGALEEHEAPDFAVHLHDCVSCRDHVRVLQVAADILPIAAPPVVAPVAIKARLMAVVDGEAQLLKAAGAPAAEVPARRRRLPVRLPQLGRLVLRPPVAVGLSCALVALGVGGGVIFDHNGSVPTRAVAVIPGTASAVQAKLLVRGEQGTLHLASMPEAPAGQVYQVWLVKRGSTKPMPTHTLFNVRSDGRANVPIEEPVKGVSQLLVTAEPSGGSLKPSGSPVISATLS